MPTENEILRRVPPQSIEAEQAVLGAIFLENAALDEISPTLRAEHFYRDTHQRIYEAMLELHSVNHPIDALTISEWLRGRDVLEACGGPAYIGELVMGTPSASNIGYYARLVRDKAVLRAIASTATQIASEAYDAPSEVEDFADSAARRINEATDLSVRTELYSAADLTRRSLAAFERAATGDATGLPTGFVDLDYLLGGLQPSNLIILAARPGRGKTALAVNIAANVFLRQSRNVLFFSLEMSKEELGDRLTCSEALVDLSRCRRGFASEEVDFPRLANAAAAIYGATGRLYVNDASDISPLAIKAIARRHARQYGTLDLVIIDYIQLMRADKEYRDASRERIVADISRSLKGLAKELRVPVLALAQLNRQSESRGGGRPMLADLRESGAIEQDADVVAFIHDEEAYKPPDERDPNAPRIVIVAKHRNGRTGDVRLVFQESYTRFQNYARDEDEAA